MTHLAALSSLLAVVCAACTQTTADPIAECEAAAFVLTECGADFEVSPFGTCQPEQHADALAVLDDYEQNGCGIDSKSDRPCGVAGYLCVEHTVEELQPFVTDGCSMFPDGVAADLTMWQRCCIEHDFAYYGGGESVDRAEADAALGQCVAEASGSPALGEAMRLGVRVGGTPVLPTPWRWGYGWKYDPVDGYRIPSEEQQQAADYDVEAYINNPTPPRAFEQRATEAQLAFVALVPGLGPAIEAVQDQVHVLAFGIAP